MSHHHWHGGELELFHPVRLKAVRTPDALNGTRADIDYLRHHGGGPVGRLCWRVGLGERHDALGDGRSQRRDARWPRLVAQETVITFLHKAFLPAPDTGLRLAGPAHDLIGANSRHGAGRTDYWCCYLRDAFTGPPILLWAAPLPRLRHQDALKGWFRLRYSMTIRVPVAPFSSHLRWKLASARNSQAALRSGDRPRLAPAGSRGAFRRNEVARDPRQDRGAAPRRGAAGRPVVRR